MQGKNQYPKSIVEHRLAWLLKVIWTRLHNKNKMFSVVAVAEPGSGKSWLSLSLCEAIDRGSDDVPRFSIDRVAFSPTEFADLVSKKWPKGTAIILDDCGLFLYSREAMTKIVRQLSKVFQSVRYKNLFLVLNLPSFTMLDSNVRKLCSAYVEPLDIDFVKEQTKAKFQYIQTNPKTGDVYFHRPEIRKRVRHPCGYAVVENTTVNSIVVGRPSKPLAEAYEKKKIGFLNEWNRKNAVEMRELEGGKKKAPAKDYRYYCKIVLKKPKKFSFEGNSKRVDAGKVVELGCSMNCALLVARSVNKELKARERGVLGS